MTDEPSFAELQRTVQRLLGRCLIRLQQYERLLKSILAESQIAGEPDSVQISHEARVAGFSKQTLGTLVGSIFDGVVVPESAENMPEPKEEFPDDRIFMSMRFQMRLPSETFESTRAAVTELVAMRNELVHHFLERFDLWSDGGCTSAIRHLEVCYARADACYVSLETWAKSIEEARAAMCAELQSPEVLWRLFNGIDSDGHVEWDVSGIVEALRMAARELGESGWVQLHRARAWLAIERPEQVPTRYGCRSWQQVLHESRCFHLEYRRDENGCRVAWFRPRATH